MGKSFPKLMSTSKTLTLSAALFAAAAPAFALGCSVDGGGPSSSSSVGATATVYNRSTHALSAGALNSVDGTYTTCRQHVDGAAWSVGVTGGSGVLTNAALTVVLNDTACVLTLTSLVADQPYGATPAITLATTFAGAASAFAAAASPLAFYANADISALTFAAPFTITVVYSDDPTAAIGSKTAGRATVASAAGSAQSVSPDYTLDSLASITVTTDANNIVQSSTGNATFTDGVVGPNLGELYVVNANQGFSAAPTFAADDAAFVAGVHVAVGEPLTIASTALLAVGTDLTGSVIRTVIVRHMDSGVAAYQTFQITFNPAP